MAFAKRNGSAPIYRTATHRKARATLLEAYQPGALCCLCGHPMWPRADGKTSNLHADHCPTCQGQGCDQCNGIGYRGLAHGTKCQDCGHICNQRDGAQRARARQETSETNLDW
jgi:hypothetical protein